MGKSTGFMEYPRRKTPWRDAVDRALDYYEIYLDTTDASTFLKQVDAVNANTSTSIAVDSNSAYSWKIIAVDTNGNKSNSGVYSFRTN